MSGQTAERLKKRRTLRRVAIVVIVLLLMPMWYVVTWLTVGIAFKRGYIPAACVAYVAIPFRPLMAYANADFYGAEALQHAFCWTNWEDVSRIFRNNDDPSDNDYSIQCGTFSPFIKVSVYRALAYENYSPVQPDEQTWQFDQASNDRAYTTRQVIEDGKPILMVIHYSDDHSWAFLCNTTENEEDVRFVTMGKALKLDSTLRTIAHLPPGCIAVRGSVGEQWTVEQSTEH